MLFWLKLTLPRQMLTLAACALLAAVGGYFLDYAPPLLIRVRHLPSFAGGAAAAVALTAVFAALKGESFSAQTKALRQMNGFALAGAVITAAAGEEVLLSGILFGTAAVHYPAGAFALVFGAAFLGYFSGRDSSALALVRALQAVIFAGVFYLSKSLFACAAAHGVSEAATIHLLDNTRLSSLRRWWRPRRTNRKRF